MRVRSQAVAAVAAALAVLSTGGCAISRAAADTHPADTRPPASAPASAIHPRPALHSIPAGLRRLTVRGRSFLLYIPRHVRRPAPLVVALGGIGSTEASEAATFRVTRSADRDHVVVAYPDPVTGTWNAGGCCWGAKADDVTFLSRMRSGIARVVPLDPQRQVLIGYSNGGMLGYEAACADRHWTAIVALGASLTTRCAPSHPFSITNVNGTTDNVAPWNGGWSTYARAMMPPVWRIDQQFATVFGCGAARASRSGSDRVYTYVGCRGGVFVRDIQVPGLGHHWPLKERDGYDMGPVLWQLAGA